MNGLANILQVAGQLLIGSSSIFVVKAYFQECQSQKVGAFSLHEYKSNIFEVLWFPFELVWVLWIRIFFFYFSLGYLWVTGSKAFDKSIFDLQ